VFGMALLFSAIIYIQYESKNIKIMSGVLIIMLSAIIFEIFQVTSTIVSRHVNTVTYLFYVNLATTSIVLMLYPKTSLNDFKIIRYNFILRGGEYE